MKQTFLAGRILLGGYLLFAGSHHFTQASALAEASARQGVPWPTAAVLVAGALLLVAGVTFILGVAPRVGIGALVLFLVPVTLMMHAFWREDGLRRTMDLVNFTKNVGLLGAALMFSAIPEPWPYSVGSPGHLRPVELRR